MGIRFDAKTVVLTAGTFLGGVIHWLKQCFRRSCWRSSFNFIAHRLRELNLPVGRLKQVHRHVLMHVQSTSLS